MFFKETCRPRISDIGRKGRISLISLLCILEDVACHHCAYVGDDVLSNSLESSAWICTNWRIRLVRPVFGVDELTATTWSREKTNGSTVLREYTICDREGNTFLIAEAKFVRLDIRSGKPVRITEELYDLYQPETKTLFEDAMERLVPPEQFELETAVALRGSDLDFNEHVHNTRFLDIAAAGIPAGGFRLSDAKEINIAYRKAVKADDTVTVRYAKTEKGCFLDIANEQGSCCFIKAEA